MVILGIDPGTATTGYGIIDVRKGEIKAISFGSIDTPKGKSAEERLEEIYNDLELIMKKFKPDLMAVESVYFYNNVKTAIAVAQARGVVLLAGRRHRLKIKEFTPLQIKQSLTSYGKADKKQVQFMVKQLLQLNQIPKPDDAADALAAAICASHHLQQS